MACSFCKISREEVLWETGTSIIAAGSQFRHGHLKVVLKRHAEDLTELPPQEYSRFCWDMLECARAVQEVFRPDKLNYALLGNWVDHVHWHIYPRYKSDPDFGQPMVMHWLKDGKRVAAPPVELEEKPLTAEEKTRLKRALEATFGTGEQ
ncbi:HIT family protein [Candidatus Bathyarchaeota archaeon]|nr:HIT family protein [Candidatus Bathyarchaeota archaeon]